MRKLRFSERLFYPCIQGFHKIDADKWEFANEGFVRGERHLLKTIKRRKSHHSSNEDGKLAALEGEIETLSKEKSVMMEEVVELQDQQRDTFQHVEDVNEKVEAMERGHKRIVSFLAKMFENPAFLARVSHLRKQKTITSPGTKRKFVEHQPHELGTFVKYQPELCNFTWPHMGDIPVFGAEDVPYGFEDDPISVAEHEPSGVEDSPVFGAVPSGVEERGEDERLVNELLHDPEGESVLTLETKDPILEQKLVISPQMETESAMVTEDPWYYLHEFDLPDLGIEHGLPFAWDVGLGNEGWLDEDSLAD